MPEAFLIRNCLPRHQWCIRCALTGVLSALALAYVMSYALADEPAKFVGGQVCSGCHAAESETWRGSHHALAMHKATEASTATANSIRLKNVTSIPMVLIVSNRRDLSGRPVKSRTDPLRRLVRTR
jgi:hypothetical protein